MVIKIVFSVFSLFLPFISLAAPLKIVATTSDLAALVNKISPEKNEVLAIGKGTQDPHHIEAKPSFIVKIRSADLLVVQGLELETAWLESLIGGARNPKIAKSSRGYLELAPLLNPIEIPHGPVSRAEGDIHPGGNPHFQLDPIRIGMAGILIAERLGELDSENKEFYLKNAISYQNLLKHKNKEWTDRVSKTRVKEIVTYHKTFAYFFDRYNLKNRFFIEPKPGIPPTAKHLQTVISAMKKDGIKLVFVENYFDNEALKKIKEDYPASNGLSVPVSVGGAPNINSTEDLIEILVKSIETSAL